MSAISVGSLLFLGSCGGGGDGDDAVQIAPTGLTGLVITSNGLKFTFTDSGMVDYVRLGAVENIGEFTVAWPDNLPNATYVYETQGTSSAVITITAPVVDYGRLISPGDGYILLDEGVAYAGLYVFSYVGPVYDVVQPLEIKISLTFEREQAGTQITSITGDILAQGVNVFTATQPEDIFVDGRMPMILRMIDGNYPVIAYDPDEDAPAPQPSDKTDGLFDNDTVILYDASNVELVKYNFTKSGQQPISIDFEAPTTESGIVQALWDTPSQSDYSLVQIYGTHDVIVTLTNDTLGNDDVITLHFQGDGTSGAYETASGLVGVFEFIENP